MLLAVLTTKREGPSGLPALLGEIDLQAWRGARVVFSDGETDYVPPQPWIKVTAQKFHPDNGEPFRSLLAYAADYDGLVFLEDDVVLARGALRKIAALEVPPELAFVSFFDAIFHAAAPHALYRAPCEAFQHAQALKLPARTMRALEAAPGWAPGLGIDVNLAVNLTGSQYGIHVPSLVQHVGRHSVAHPKRSGWPVSYTYLHDARNVTVRGVPIDPDERIER